MVKYIADGKTDEIRDSGVDYVICNFIFYLEPDAGVIVAITSASLNKGGSGWLPT